MANVKYEVPGHQIGVYRAGTTVGEDGREHLWTLVRIIPSNARMPYDQYSVALLSDASADDIVNVVKRHGGRPVRSNKRHG